MKISILTVFKELYNPFITTSLLKRAQEKGLVSFDIHSLFEYVAPKERIDAPPFGPGTGMVLKPEVIQKGIESQEKAYGKAFRIFFSPQGKKLDQDLLKDIAEKIQKTDHLMLVPARYEGMDARVEEFYADMVISIGDYVLMGGDIPAMVLLEGVTRLLPGVVSKEESIIAESFSGPFLDYPEYTEPVDWKGLMVPEIVRSGNHAAIAQWRQQQAIQKTVKTHFDWLKSYPLSDKERKQVKEGVPTHYVALMHDQVLTGKSLQEGTTSVMSIDIHDIARSSKTYGIKNYFIVTPLIDQQKIIDHFLEFWREEGETYRQDRHAALGLVSIKNKLKEVIDEIEEKEGKKPLLVATCARAVEKVSMITFHDQSEVWQHDRPILFLFGTGNGLSEELLRKCDYVLVPLEGLTEFNHLSVRSATAIVLDRWLGINQKKLKEEQK